jgi:hypothetical protein
VLFREGVDEFCDVFDRLRDAAERRWSVADGEIRLGGVAGDFAWVATVKR